MKYEYKRSDFIKDTTLEAYGKVFEIPPKTSSMADSLISVSERIAKNGATAMEQAAAMRDGIAVFIGEKNAEEIFPKGKLADIDTNEMSAFWLLLNNISNEETRAVLQKYSPRPAKEILMPKK